MNEKIKHCPFCGGKAKLLDWPVENNTHTLYAVVCHNSKCYINPESPYYDTLEEAIEAWNRRVE